MVPIIDNPDMNAQKEKKTVEKQLVDSNANSLECNILMAFACVVCRSY